MAPSRRGLLLLLLLCLAALLGVSYLGAGAGGALRRPAFTPYREEAVARHPSRSLQGGLPATPPPLPPLPSTDERTAESPPPTRAPPPSTKAPPPTTAAPPPPKAAPPPPKAAPPPPKAAPPPTNKATLPPSSAEAAALNTELLKTILRQKPAKPAPAQHRSPSRPLQQSARRPTKHALFTFAAYRPGKNSPPIRHGVSAALARLNLEFSPNELEAVTANSAKTVPAWAEGQGGNVMGVAGAGTRVGSRVATEASRHILVATTWRSGSTFLGDLLNHYPGTFYYFEPLHYYSQLARDQLDKVQDPVDFLHSLYTCSFTSANVGFLHHVAAPANKFLLANHNKRLWNSCSNVLPRDMMCLLPEYLNSVCPLYPIKLIKTVRLRVAKVEPLLQDPAMDLKVILLVRDPRGVYNSRGSGQVTTWCKQDACSDPATGCRDLAADVAAAEQLATRYPGSVTLVRYEDLSLLPEETARGVLKFLDLPWHAVMDKYIDSHTSREKMKMVRNKVTKKLEKVKDTYGTARNSTATAFAWRQKLGLGNVTDIQEMCGEPMARLGYRSLHTREELAGADLPIDKTAQEVWGP